MAHLGPIMFSVKKTKSKQHLQVFNKIKYCNNIETDVTSKATLAYHCAW